MRAYAFGSDALTFNIGSEQRSERRTDGERGGIDDVERDNVRRVIASCVKLCAGNF